MRFILLFLSVSIVIAAPIIRIAGGQASHAGQFPYSIEIVSEYEDNTFSFCGGTLISRRYALTAAHCFLDRTERIPRSISAVIGVVNLNDRNALVVPITQATYHPNYNARTSENDIAVVVLSRDVQESSFIQYAYLATQTPPIGTLTYVSGWGITRQTEKKPPATQSYAELTVVSGSRCSSYFSMFNNEDFLCLFGNNQQPCSGDSGSGAVIRQNSTDRYTVVGVVSYGADSCTSREDSLTAFSSVSTYFNFIALNANLSSIPSGDASVPQYVAGQMPHPDATNPSSGDVSGVDKTPARSEENAAITVKISVLAVMSAFLLYML